MFMLAAIQLMHSPKHKVEYTRATSPSLNTLEQGTIAAHELFSEI